MPAHNSRRIMDFLTAMGVIGILFMMLIPLPTWMLSFLLVLNLALSITVLLMTTYVQDILQFSVFPTVLLGLTLFRLALNISSTKLILLKADGGSVLQAFGEVVVKGNAVVGFIIFLILIIVQFIVITKGAERVSEVAARFTLDALPGKQMGVDAELNAGLINEEQARSRRDVIEQEADFYGAMDGSSKFVRGDAIASIVVVIINILGGITVGFLQKNMDWLEIVRTYTILTIGDGLVNQVPALIVSTATGILVTRSTAKSTLGYEILKQFSIKPKALILSGIALLTFSLIGVFSGFPAIPFFVVGIPLLVLGTISRNHETKKQQQKPKEKEKKEKTKGPEDILPHLNIETLELELGYGLLFLVDPKSGGDLLDRVSAVRRQCAREIGIVIPPVRIRDNGTLTNNAYAIKIRGHVIAKGELMPKSLLAMSTGFEQKKIKGIETKEPTFGIPATWIRSHQRREAEIAGYTVVDNASVVATHLTEIIKSHAHELLGRQETQTLLNELKAKGYTAVFDELMPQHMNLGAVQHVLQNLLKERISIRNLLVILESLSDTAAMTKDTEVLTEYVRTSLSRQISSQYRGRDGTLVGVTLSPDTEKSIFDSIKKTDRGASLVLDPKLSEELAREIGKKMSQPSSVGGQPVLLCSPAVRPYVKKHFNQFIPNIDVLSYNEITPDTKVHSLGSIQFQGKGPALGMAS